MSDAQSTTKSLVLHQFNDTPIRQRAKDGYLDATAMCRATEKLFNDYARLQSTKDFLIALESDTGIPVTEQIQSVRGGSPELQGTWVHPFVAVNLGQWCSPLCAVFVSKLVIAWTETTKNSRKARKTSRQLTPAERELEELEIRRLHAKAAVRQERLDALVATHSADVPAVSTPIQQLSIIQWLYQKGKALNLVDETLFGKECTRLSRFEERLIGQVADRRWRNEDGSWKCINAYDVDIIEKVWISFRTERSAE